MNQPNNPEVILLSEINQLMQKDTTNTAFKLVKFFYQDQLKDQGEWKLFERRHAVCGVRTSKRNFFFRRHRCPVCKLDIEYHTLMFKALDSKGQPCGKPRMLPYAFTSESFTSLRRPTIGVCSSGHIIALSAYVHYSEDGPSSDPNTYQCIDGKFVRI